MSEELRQARDRVLAEHDGDSLADQYTRMAVMAAWDKIIGTNDESPAQPE